jgi:predicted transcriptional regulator
MKRTLKVRVASVALALDRFEEVWNKAARDEKVHPERVLTFVNLQLLLHTLTPTRWTLSEQQHADGSLSVNELAASAKRAWKAFRSVKA